MNANKKNNEKNDRRDANRKVDKLYDRLLARRGKKISLKDFDPGYVGRITDKEEAVALLEKGVEELARQQDRLYAQNTWALLIIFQAMDAAGKDGTIKHVMSGVNPQGCQVFTFKAPSGEERDHDYLWRSMRALPERGRIGIHNRSYYEEVLVARVHPGILAGQQLPPELKTKRIWKERFEQINDFERYLVENGIKVLKFYLNVSKAEQKKRFLERIDTPAKNWKFAVGDVRERAHWDDYMRAYEDVFTHTSTEWAPWFIVPADNKWFMRLAVAGIVYKTLQDLDLQYPEVTEQHRKELQEARELLLQARD
jgi:PPK2 family polyphosphate:nucleotide phosphotransferase